MQTAAVPKKASPHPKPKRQPTFIRQWRRSFGWSLAKLAERLLVLEEIEITEGQLSRIERGESPYVQDLLDAIARVMGLETVDLLVRDPSKPEPIWSIWEGLTPVERVQAVEVIKALKRSA